MSGTSTPEADARGRGRGRRDRPKRSRPIRTDARRRSHAELLARLETELGDAVLDRGRRLRHARRAGAPRSTGARAAEVAKGALECDYLSFVVRHRLDAGARRRAATTAGDTSSPVQPTETTYGVAGSDGRFQVFAHVQSTARHWGVTLKADVDDESPARRSRGCRCTRAPTGTSASAGRCTASCFDGHPALRHLYLPSEFEGHPLRKDFPLLARVVKPWPGLVDVEPMPGRGRRRRGRGRRAEEASA